MPKPYAFGDFFNFVCRYPAHDQQCGRGKFCLLGKARHGGPTDLLLRAGGFRYDDARQIFGLAGFAETA